jgi:cytochrome c
VDLPGGFGQRVDRLAVIGIQWLCLGALCLAGCSAAVTVAGDPLRGQQLYERRCADCHDPDENSNGPRHRGIYGRRAGSVPDYHYSKALAQATIVWNDASLNAWLTDPQALVPGQRMKMRVPDPQDRADLIAYLKTLTP